MHDAGLAKDYLYTGLDFAVDMDSRIALVGPNGAGKSTLLKLIMEEIRPTVGEIGRNGHLRIGYYNQHSEVAMLTMMIAVMMMMVTIPTATMTSVPMATGSAGPQHVADRIHAKDI